jgi:hypothetical protein
MSNSFIWRGKEPQSKFGPRIYAPMYIASDGNADFNKKLIDYVLECENLIAQEPIVSKLHKSTADPYKFTQQWKQHNLLDDTGPRKDGDHLTKFTPKPELMAELFDKIRTNYLLMLAELNFPRRKVWIHTWGNVIRQGEYISFHTHVPTDLGYLACVYYPQTSPTELYMVNPISGNNDVLAIPTKENSVVLFPSWMPHCSTRMEEPGYRISIASDIVLEETMASNPWRPHILLDDPETMPGL